VYQDLQVADLAPLSANNVAVDHPRGGMSDCSLRNVYAMC